MLNQKELLDELRKSLVELEKQQAPTEKVIILDEASRQRIERAIGHNVSSAEQLATRIERAFEVSVEGIKVPLQPYLLDRMKSRAIRVEWEKFVPMTIKRLLEEYVGIR